MLVLQLAEHVFVGQSTIGISLFKLETPYADPHVRCCERCDAKTSAYSIVILRELKASIQVHALRHGLIITFHPFFARILPAAAGMPECVRK